MVSKRVVLNREQVRDALVAAAMARAGELSQFGSLKVSSLSLDTRMENGALGILGAVAVVEAEAAGAATDAAGREAGEGQLA